MKENPISSLSKELFIKKLTNIFDLAPTPTSNLQKEIAKKALGLAIVQYDFLDEVNNLLNPSFISKFDLNDTISNAIDKRSKNLSNLPESKNIEHGLLKLCCDKALSRLDWLPILDFEATIKYTATWYLSYYKNPESIQKFTRDQIEQYNDMCEKFDFEGRF